MLVITRWDPHQDGSRPIRPLLLSPDLTNRGLKVTTNQQSPGIDQPELRSSSLKLGMSGKKKLIGGFKHVFFSIIYGMSSFPLTNSYFSRWLLHHQPENMDSHGQLDISSQSRQGVYGLPFGFELDTLLQDQARPSKGSTQHAAIPSGYLIVCHGKSSFLIGKPSINGRSIPWLC